MDYTHLGRSGLVVSRLCLGTMNFGPDTDVATSHAIMDRALDLGINFFDTANVYGGNDFKGRTESIIGDWFAMGGRREKVVLASKLFGYMEPRPNFGRYSALGIRRACDDSLRRLKTDYIDVYQMHQVDRSVPWDEVWEAMDVLRQQGKILYVGSSNFAGWHIAEAQEAARRFGMLGLVSEQSVYNLAARMVELEVLPAAQAYGLGVLPWSPLNSGLLGGVLRKIADGTVQRGTTWRSADVLGENRAAVEAWEAFCAERGLDPASVAIAWLLHQPAVTAPIVGPRTMAQFETALDALTMELDDDALARLDEIFPGPGGPAPMAYKGPPVPDPFELV